MIESWKRLERERVESHARQSLRQPRDPPRWKPLCALHRFFHLLISRRKSRLLDISTHSGIAPDLPFVLCIQHQLVSFVRLFDSTSIFRSSSIYIVGEVIAWSPAPSPFLTESRSQRIHQRIRLLTNQWHKGSQW